MDDQDLQPLLDTAQNQLQITLSDSDSSDSKGLAISGIDLALGIFALQSETNSSWWLLVPFFIVLLISLFTSLAINVPRRYKGAMVDLEEHPEYLELCQQDLILQLLADTQAYIAYNTDRNRQKSRLSLIALITTLLATALLVCCII
jgi:hypothetical protein